MNKSSLLKQILEELAAVHQGAIEAALLAYDTATHEANVAENKYDTLGLEAAYLAQGQAKRVSECEADLKAYQNLIPTKYSCRTPVSVGALIVLMDESGSEQYLFLGPAAGGLKVIFRGKEIVIITPLAPLGKELLGCFIHDELEIDVAGRKMQYEILAVY